MDLSAISPLFNRSRTQCSQRALQMHVKGLYFLSRVRRLNMPMASTMVLCFEHHNLHRWEALHHSWRER